MLKVGKSHLETVLERFDALPKGRVLDFGTGPGTLARALAQRRFDVAACDIDTRPEWTGTLGIAYTQCNFNAGVPLPDQSFEYICCLEVIEHVENPFALCRELMRLLKPGGALFLSTPNILRLRGRVQYFFDGALPYFDYPVIEWDQMGVGAWVHVNPIRYHELEFYLHKAGLAVEEVFSSYRRYSWRLLVLPELIVRLRAWAMARRHVRKAKPRLERLYKVLLSDHLLYGEHLIVKAVRPPR